jgi:excisionase family DNA binding protein
MMGTFHFFSPYTKSITLRQSCLEFEEMPNTEDRWFSIHEICEHLGVSSDTVYKWIDKHDMPAHRMGRLWKFKKDQVDAWIEAGGAADKSEKPDTEQ